MTTNAGGTYKLYSTYMFRDKDPIVDHIRTIVKDSGRSYQDISDESGVSVGTYYNWFMGETKRPQFAPLMATARALGYDLQLVKTGASQIAPRRTAKIIVLDVQRPRKRAAA